MTCHWQGPGYGITAPRSPHEHHPAVFSASMAFAVNSQLRLGDVLGHRGEERKGVEVRLRAPPPVRDLALAATAEQGAPQFVAVRRLDGSGRLAVPKRVGAVAGPHG